MEDIFGLSSTERARPALVDGVPKYHFPFATWTELTRPANANQYTANDIINEVAAKALKFPDVVTTPGGAFCITNSLIISSFTPATALTAFVMLFDKEIIGPADHATLTLTDDMMKHMIGVLNINTQVKATAGCVYTPPWNDPIYGRCANLKKDIWGILMALSAYTPGSSEYIRIYLSGFEYA